MQTTVNNAITTEITPSQVIDKLREGLEEIGKKYESGEYFLSELIMSGETAKAALEVLKPHFKKIDQKMSEVVPLGSSEASNKRTIYKYIRPPEVESCQLVMGMTTLESGSIWSTMAPHTHERRTEIYLYFDLADQVLFHFMGRPEQTRHLVIRDKQAVTAFVVAGE